MALRARSTRRGNRYFTWTLRKRECTACGFLVTTMEVPVPVAPQRAVVSRLEDDACGPELGITAGPPLNWQAVCTWRNAYAKGASNGTRTAAG